MHTIYVCLRVLQDQNSKQFRIVCRKPHGVKVNEERRGVCVGLCEGMHARLCVKTRRISVSAEGEAAISTHRKQTA